MRSYVGVTVGPIFDTINDASSPAALWFASNLFSDLTRRICKGVSEEASFSEVRIYSPYYAFDIDLSDGVGKFHDRVIFSAECFSKEKMDVLLDTVKAETIDVFPEEFKGEAEKEFLKEYLQIHYVVRSEEQIGNANCVHVLSPYLDALELMKSFPKDDSCNPIQKLFMGEKGHRNEYIKKSPLFQRVTAGGQLKGSGDSIRTIGEIASNSEVKDDKTPLGLKHKHYYAVVSADGDNMGSFLEGLSDDQITEFSRTCLAYDKAASDLIGAYGGMTIYAGGDDLLFLAPIMTDESNVFELCTKIRTQFNTQITSNTTFCNMGKIPTVSFGISIQYKKFPLYEALESSRDLLSLAKSDGGKKKDDYRKNNMMIELQKHSGQSISLLVSDESSKVLQEILSIGNNASNDAELIHSVLYTLDTFSSLVSVLNNEVRRNAENLTPERYRQYVTAWENFFDNAGQQSAKGYIDEICAKYYDNMVIKESGISVPSYGLTESDKQENVDESLRALLYLLKLKHFLAEKEGDRQ